MLEFHPVEITDKEWVQPLLKAEQLPLCAYSFTPLFCWQHVYKHEICQFENRLLVRVRDQRGYAYFWPAGEGDVTPALRALEEDARANDTCFRLLTIQPHYLPRLEALYGGRMETTSSPDTYDYLYDVNRLADLPGKKLHAKRNHINRFRENYPNWHYTPLTEADIPDCLELDRKWYQEHLDANGGERDESVYMDRAAMVTALNYFEALGMDGGVLRSGEGGEVLAFTLGTRLTDTVFDVNFERARNDVQGTFPVINQEFSKWIRSAYPHIEFIDREEDMGHLGLRRAKQSYYPDRMSENISVSIAL